MLLSSIDFSSIVSSILKDDLELGVKLYLLTNPKLALVFMGRLNNVINVRLAALNTALTNILSQLTYVHREEKQADPELVSNVKNEIGQFQNKVTVQNKIASLIVSFKELKDSKGSLGISGIDAKQEIYTLLKLAEELNNQLIELTTNLNKAEANWSAAELKNSVEQKIGNKVKTVIENVITNIDNNSKADSSIVLVSCLELLRSFSPINPFLSPATINASLLSLDDKAVSSSTGINTTSTVFSVTIGPTAFSFNYPASGVTSVYILSKQNTYTIPANSSLYLKITATGIPTPAASGSIPAGTANYPITAGVLSIDTLITLLNTTTIIDSLGAPRLYLIAGKTANNELVVSGVPGVTKIEVIGSVMGTLVMGTYTEPRYPVHNELGFVSGQVSGLSLQHLADFLVGNNLNVTKDSVLTLTANENIIINTGIATDIGMQSTITTATEYSSSYVIDQGDVIDDTYTVEQTNPIKLTNGPKMAKTSFRLKSIAVSECKRVANLNYKLDLTRLNELVDVLLQQKIPTEASIKTEVNKLIVQVQDYINKYRMLWTISAEDKAVLDLLTRTIEEKAADLYLAQLNNCQFNKLTENTKASELLTKIEVVGQQLVQ
jgi:hypothetical protein